jgi:hypothetical protein
LKPIFYFKPFHNIKEYYFVIFSAESYNMKMNPTNAVAVDTAEAAAAREAPDHEATPDDVTAVAMPGAVGALYGAARPVAGAVAGTVAGAVTGAVAGAASSFGR